MRIAWLGLALLLFGPRGVWADDLYTVVVTGASGGADDARLHTEWRQTLVDALRAEPGFRDDRLFVLAEVPGPGLRRASAEGIRDTFTELRRRMTSESVLLVVLIGHGTDDGVDAKFNLVGPDLTARDWARVLDSLPGRSVFVNTTGSSYPFVAALARPGRVVITATAAPGQRYDTVFPRFFVDAWRDPAADADRDGRVSVWEAFAVSSQRVRRWYQDQGQLATERPLLDDSGDGIGAEAESMADDGDLAARLYVGAGLGPSPVEPDAALAPLVAEQEALRAQIDQLMARKAELGPAAYQQDLERLLLELARVSRRIRHAMQEL